MKKRKVRRLTINVMAALLVGDPKSPTSAATLEARAKFIKQLEEMKRLGVEAVSIDFWWGLIEPVEGHFDWTYYDWIVNAIIEKGLKFIPILSFHQCGGNVGDDVYVPIPAWVWVKLEKLLGNIRDARFVSEQGNECKEYVSFWVTKLILESYVKVMKAFREHFADRAEHIAEINVSLGPSGELRFPSYNSHDVNTDYPTRGALQCYAAHAVSAFQAWALEKYKDLAGIDKAWGTNTVGGQAIRPPSNPAQFFNESNQLKLQYGRDFFDWYSDSALNHARMMINAAFEVFAADDSPMKGIDIGVKVPGIHWLTGQWEFDAVEAAKTIEEEVSELILEAQINESNPAKYGEQLAEKVAKYIRERLGKWDPNVEGGKLKIGSRLAELAAGLIRTSNSEEWANDAAGHGYRPLLKFFSEFKDNKNSRLVLHFTCLEMKDGEGSALKANSIARSLVRWFGEEAHRQGVIIKGENAVWWNLPQRETWERMRSHLLLSQEAQGSYYEGLTILRMTHVADNPVANEEMAKTVELLHKQNELNEDEESESEVIGSGSMIVSSVASSSSAEALTAAMDGADVLDAVANITAIELQKGMCVLDVTAVTPVTVAPQGGGVQSDSSDLPVEGGLNEIPQPPDRPAVDQAA